MRHNIQRRNSEECVLQFQQRNAKYDEVYINVRVYVQRSMHVYSSEGKVFLLFFKKKSLPNKTRLTLVRCVRIPVLPDLPVVLPLSEFTSSDSLSSIIDLFSCSPAVKLSSGFSISSAGFFTWILGFASGWINDCGCV